MIRIGRIVHGLLFLAVVLGLQGCRSKLDDDRTTTVLSGGFLSLDYDPPKKDQQVVIEISSPGAPLSAFLVLKQDLAAAEKAIEDNRAPMQPLAKMEKIESATLEASVPAGSAFALILSNDSANDAQVKVRSKGR